MKLTVIVFFVSICSFGQNLVPNPSFEFGSICKSQSPNSSLPKDFSWWEPNFTSSVDIFSECNGTVPISHAGNEMAQHGENYVGCALKEKYNGLSRWREFAEAELLTPLTKGKKYLISFYCTNMENHSVEIKNVDIGFTRKKKEFTILFSRFSVINPFKNIESEYPSINGWTHKSIVYEATGKENFIVIGNFVSCNRLEKKKQTNSTYGTFNRAYYAYDNISVIEIPPNYGLNRNDSTEVFEGKKIANQPQVNDSLNSLELGFNLNEKKIKPAFDSILISIANYLTINPFLVISLAMNESTDYSGTRKSKLMTIRENEIILRLEELGVSSNRLYFKWHSYSEEGSFGIINNIDGEIITITKPVRNAD